MFLRSSFSLLALATAAFAAVNTTTSNPNRYLQAPIYRNGEANNPIQGYYWIDLGFGPYTVPVIVDSGYPLILFL